MSGALWEVGGSRLYCIKGTPEQILPLCKFRGEELFAAPEDEEGVLFPWLAGNGDCLR